MRKILIVLTVLFSVFVLFAETLLIKTPEDAEKSKYDNLKLGVPSFTDCVIDREGYALGYSEKYEQPLWVSYILTTDELLTTNKVPRTNKFKADPHITTGSALPSDYTRTGYDRGHLAPAADMSFSVTTMDESFYMSNMSPQRPGCNRGVWKRLEDKVRQIAIREKTIYIVTGCIFYKDKDGNKVKPITINGNVAVPDAYYKVIFDMTKPYKMIGYIIPNSSSQHDLSKFAVTVDEVEKLTGLDFFSKLPKKLQDELEATITVGDWD